MMLKYWACCSETWGLVQSKFAAAGTFVLYDLSARETP